METEDRLIRPPLRPFGAALFPLKGVDYAPLAEELTAAGVPAYIFTSDDPDTICREYLALFGIDPE